MNDYHDFRERLAFSEGIQPGGSVINAIIRMIPNAVDIQRADTDDDRNGTDYWILRGHNLPSLSVDMKNRELCPIARFGSDDACIETTSVYRGRSEPYEDARRSKIGWTLDLTKRTDYIVYTWPSDNGIRYWILPFPPLCAAARMYWREWARRYREKQAPNREYVTLSVYPPRPVIACAMKELMYGDTGEAPPRPSRYESKPPPEMDPQPGLFENATTPDTRRF